MSTSKRNLYTASLAVSLIGVFLLLTENFGAWQDRNSFYGVVEYLLQGVHGTRECVTGAVTVGLQGIDT